MYQQKIQYITPTVTPMCPDGSLDLESCARLYEHLIRGGVDGILVTGSIGEFFALTTTQRRVLIDFAVKTVNKRVPLIFGTTSMVFEEMVELSNYALDQGADAVMILPPYYFHFDDEAVLAYFGELATAIHGNIYLYNFPDRVGYELSPAVVRELARKHPNIIGIKDTKSGMDHTRELIKQAKSVRPDFQVYCGYDDNFLHNILSGGDGCIGGLSNLYPGFTAKMVAAARSGDWNTAQQCQQTIDKLMDIYSVGKPFIPYMKEAMVQLGIIRYATATKPMPVATAEEKEKLRAIMENAQI